MNDRPEDDRPEDDGAADGQDEAAAIAIRLDVLLSERQMTLTELSDRVGVTTARWIASQATCCPITLIGRLTGGRLPRTDVPDPVYRVEADCT